MHEADGGNKLLWYQPGNFTSEASAEFSLTDPMEVVLDDYEGDAIGDEGFFEIPDDSSVVVSKTIP